MNWAEEFAAWEVIANFVATLVATALGVWLAVRNENRRSRRRERQSSIRRGIALTDEAGRYPLEGPIDDVSVMAVAFPLWLARGQTASDLNEVTPALGAWVLWKLQALHHPGSPEMSASEVGTVLDAVRGALHDELKPKRSRRPVGWYAAELRREQMEFASRFNENLRRARAHRSPGATAALPVKSARRSKLPRWWPARLKRRREGDAGQRRQV